MSTTKNIGKFKKEEKKKAIYHSNAGLRRTGAAWAISISPGGSAINAVVASTFIVATARAVAAAAVGAVSSNGNESDEEK